LIAAHGANAATNLVRECLKGEAMIRRCERAGDAITRTFTLSDGEKFIDRLFETAMQ
jgi:hypothetical protein